MRLWGASLLLVLAAAPAAAQPQPDPIGALLDKPGRATPEMEEPDAAGQPPPAAEPAPPRPAAAAPYTPSPYSPQVARPKLTAPVRIEETGKAPDAPPTFSDLAYEARLRSSFASAQGFQGPLDGAWTLSAADQGEVYALQLVDRGGGVIEGAWRDLRRKGALGSSGFVDDIQRSGAGLILRFTPSPGAPTSVATLQGGYDGRWSGELVEGGQRHAASLRRAGR